MMRFTITTALTIAVLLLCGRPSRIQAQGDTKIVVGDGGSLRLHADGIDAGNPCKLSKDEVRHQNGQGVLSHLTITEAGADRCAGNATCGVNPAKPWKIQVTYGSGSVTIASISSNKGLHLSHHNLPFDRWQRTANTDEREFGHGDGLHISSIKVNNGANLCSGKGCEITLLYSPR